MSVLDAIREYAIQTMRNRMDINELLKYIKHIQDRIKQLRFILLSTIIRYIKNQQVENLKQLDIDGIKALPSETEQVMAVANFAAIKYSNTKNTIVGLIPFIKQWELFCMSNCSDKLRKEIEMNFVEMYKIIDSLTE
jgi:pyruvate formate-lyase activating enzyme-like uncharacterized protein